MKRLLPLTLALTFIAAPVHAAAPSVTDVGAYFKVEQGFMVSWTLPTNLTGISGYTVVASNGAKCVARGSNQNQCTYSSSTVPNP